MIAKVGNKATTFPFGGVGLFNQAADDFAKGIFVGGDDNRFFVRERVKKVGFPVVVSQHPGVIVFNDDVHESRPPAPSVGSDAFNQQIGHVFFHRIFPFQHSGEAALVIGGFENY